MLLCIYKNLVRLHRYTVTSPLLISISGNIDADPKYWRHLVTEIANIYNTDTGIPDVVYWNEKEITFWSNLLDIQQWHFWKFPLP